MTTPARSLTKSIETQFSSLSLHSETHLQTLYKYLDRVERSDSIALVNEMIEFAEANCKKFSCDELTILLTAVGILSCSSECEYLYLIKALAQLSPYMATEHKSLYHTPNWINELALLLQRNSDAQTKIRYLQATIKTKLSRPDQDAIGATEWETVCIHLSKIFSFTSHSELLYSFVEWIDTCTIKDPSLIRKTAYTLAQFSTEEAPEGIDHTLFLWGAFIQTDVDETKELLFSMLEYTPIPLLDSAEIAVNLFKAFTQCASGKKIVLPQFSFFIDNKEIPIDERYEVIVAVIGNITLRERLTYNEATHLLSIITNFCKNELTEESRKLAVVDRFLQTTWRLDCSKTLFTEKTASGGLKHAHFIALADPLIKCVQHLEESISVTFLDRIYYRFLDATIAEIEWIVEDSKTKRRTSQGTRHRKNHIAALKTCLVEAAIKFSHLIKHPDHKQAALNLLEKLQQNSTRLSPRKNENIEVDKDTGKVIVPPCS